MMNKRMLAALLSIVFILSLVPANTFGQNGTIARNDNTVTKVLELTKWKVAPGVEHMLTIPSIDAMGTELNSLSDWTLNNLVGKKIPEPVRDAEAISADWDTGSWPEVSVPGSLLGGLMDLGVYDELFDIGNDGKREENYDVNRTKVPADFDIPWWYSVDFELSAEDLVAAGKYGTLTFKGINYTGQVFINGTEIKNKNTNITNVEELYNRTGTLVLEGVEHLGDDFLFAKQPLNGQDTTRLGDGFPAESVKKGAYSYTLPAPMAFPGANNTWPEEGVSTADRREWADWHDSFQGAFRTYELDVTPYLQEGTNNIKVKMTRGDRSNDFNYNLHDWHMTPVDRMMGLTYPVTLAFTGAVRLSNPFASFEVNKANTSADAHFYVDVNNMTGTPIAGAVQASVYSPDDPNCTGTPVKKLSKDVTVPANAYNHEVAFDTETFSGSDLQLWWPYGSGEQPLYKVTYEFIPQSGTATDSLTHRFGIRQITNELNKYSANEYGVMMQVYVNHKPIVIKGGGYTPTDLYIRQDPLTDRSVIDLVKSMGMNTIRDEGKFFNDNLYDLMDEEGIMLMTGYMCCDRHEVSGTNNWTLVERFILYEHTYAQVRNVRSHTCMIGWLNGSDYTKDGSNLNTSQGAKTSLNSHNAAQKMMEIEGKLRFYDHGLVIASGSGRGHGGVSDIIGLVSGTEMQHSYDTVVPTFYYSSIPDKAESGSSGIVSNSARGIYGFISEGGGGAGVPVLETLKRMIPEENLWPYNQGGTDNNDPVGNYNKWNYHAARGGGNFAKIDAMVAYNDNAFGGAESVEEWVMQAQLYDYEYQRAIYEALSKHRYSTATGFINWMMNGVRPTIMWNQFDFYMNPHGSTYGVAKANEPVHIMYDPYNKEISVANYTFEDFGTMTAEMTLYDIEGNIISETLRTNVDVVPDAIGERTGSFKDRVIGFEPNVREGDNWYNDAEYTPVTYSYPAAGNNQDAQINPAGNKGIQIVWDQEDIDGSLTRPTSDVYFMRLELMDSNNEVVSYNSYAVARKESVSSGTSGWARGTGSQSMDWTQLKSLPAVELDVYVHPHMVDGDYIVQQVEITNSTGAVAHGVELKTYVDGTATELCPAVYDDNLITLYPGQTRTITVKHHKDYLNGAAAIRVNCYNNTIGNRKENASNIYHSFSPENQTNTSTIADAPNATTNLARGRTFAAGLEGGSYSFIANVTGVSADANNLANQGKSVIDSNLMTNQAVSAANGGFRIDLGEEVTFDRTMVRWGNPTAGGVNWMAGTPDKIKIEVSNDNDNWTSVSIGGSDTFDNTAARAPMTNIIFDEPVTARYIRYTLSGLTTASAVYGTGSGTVGSPTTPARAAATQWHVTGVEVYNSFNYVFIDIGENDETTVALDGTAINLTKDTPVFVMGTALNDTGATRHLKLYEGQEIKITITPPEGTRANAYLNDKDITHLLGEDTQSKNFYLTLDNELIKGYARISFSNVPLYSVTFDSDGGTYIPPQTGLATNAKVNEPDEPRKFGHIFDGWYTTATFDEGTKWDFENGKVQYADITLYAKWVKEAFTVQFDPKTYGVAAFEVQADYGDKLTAPEDPVRDGFEFGGWYKETSCINEWDFDYDVVTWDLTLYAKWIPDGENGGKWTVAFETFGYDGEPVENQFVSNEANAVDPGELEWLGGDFIGWSSEPDYYAPFDFETPITGDTLIYAIWDLYTFEVAFDAMGGSAVDSMSLYYNDAVTEPEAPEREGFLFQYWYTIELDSEGMEIEMPWLFDDGEGNGDKVKGDTTLYALWHYEIPLMVSFNTNGGSAVPGINVYRENEKIDAPDAEPTKQGYVFGGWYKDPELTALWDFANDIVNENITLYAKWIESDTAVYTVTFESNGGTPVSPITGVEDGARISEPAAPTRNGYHFDGWYADRSLTQRWHFDRDTVTGNITLYAKWTSAGSSGGGGGGAVASGSSGSSGSANATANQKSVDSQLKNGSDVVLDFGARRSAMEINNTTLKNIAEKEGTLSVMKGVATLVLNKANLTALSGKTGITNIRISVPENAEIIGGKFNVQITKGFNKVSDLGGTLSLVIDLSSVNLSQSEINNLAAVIVNNDGTEHILGGVYDPENLSFTFETAVLGDFILKTEGVQGDTAQAQEQKTLLVLTIGETSYTSNGSARSIDAAPIIVNDRTLVPIRFIAESLGAKVDWYPDTGTVTVSLEGKTLNLTVGQLAPGLDVPPQIMNDRVMVPLRYISESFDAIVDFDDVTGKITIEK